MPRAFRYSLRPAQPLATRKSPKPNLVLRFRILGREIVLSLSVNRY